MAYRVKEIFYSLQGEGFMQGRAMVLCRFSGCNLWSGLEKDRASAICSFCDTDFRGTDGLGGGVYETPEALVQAVLSFWPSHVLANPFVVLAGGEPLLQVDEALIQFFKKHNLTLAIESNGTRQAPAGLDWICVSPKAKAALVQKKGDEIKLVYPQDGLDPEDFEELAFKHFYLQPKDGPEAKKHLDMCVDYCLKHPKWRLSLQTQKTLGIR